METETQTQTTTLTLSKSARDALHRLGSTGSTGAGVADLDTLIANVAELWEGQVRGSLHLLSAAGWTYDDLAFALGEPTGNGPLSSGHAAPVIFGSIQMGLAETVQHMVETLPEIVLRVAEPGPERVEELIRTLDDPSTWHALVTIVDQFWTIPGTHEAIVAFYRENGDATDVVGAAP